jgi:acetyltransferase-like isoleucine patch superfamily enzyme
VIAKGVSIGSCSVIGAMSYVNKDIPSGKKAWGCPAQVVGDVEDIEFSITGDRSDSV